MSAIEGNSDIHQRCAEGPRLTQKRHSGFGLPRAAANPLVALGRPHWGLNSSAENHPPDPIRQFAPHLEASHRLLILTAEVRTSVFASPDMDVDLEDMAT
jgi:hypothetical protein